MAENAWVTLVTNDSYALGAQVLGHSLKKVNTKYKLVVLVTPGVTDCMKEKLSKVFDLVHIVNVLDSKDVANLALLARPELGVTFTKIHCWNLTQFNKCVFLDADTLVIQNSDDLFERDEFSAAPDVGWPDCFNSGVFVFKPSVETFNNLLKLATDQGSFDGGDQGLLNTYFANWSLQDSSKRLPFVYNLCSIACYSYLPAFKQYGHHVRIFHFIGNNKPWLQHFDTVTCQVQSSSNEPHLGVFLQFWWNIFFEKVHPNLNQNMGGLAAAYAQMSLGVAQTEEQTVLEEKLRKDAWEAGHIDYLGRDSFDNILQKISETLSLTDKLPNTSAAKVNTSAKQTKEETVEVKADTVTCDLNKAEIKQKDKEEKTVSHELTEKNVCESAGVQITELGPAVLVEKTPEIGPAVLVKKGKIEEEKSPELGPGVISTVAICPNLTVAEIYKPPLLAAEPEKAATQTPVENVKAAQSVVASPEIKSDTEKAQPVPNTPDVIEATPPTTPLSAVQQKDTEVAQSKSEAEKQTHSQNQSAPSQIQNLKIDDTVLNTPPVESATKESIFEKEKLQNVNPVANAEVKPIDDSHKPVVEEQKALTPQPSAEQLSDKTAVTDSSATVAEASSITSAPIVPASMTDNKIENKILLDTSAKETITAEASKNAEVCAELANAVKKEVCPQQEQSVENKVNKTPDQEVCSKQESCINLEVCAKQESCAAPESCVKQDTKSESTVTSTQEICEKPIVNLTQEPCTLPECVEKKISTKSEPCATSEPCAKEESCAAPEVCAKQESCATPEVCAKQESCALPEVCAKQESCIASEVCPKQETCAAVEVCAVTEACPKQETCPTPEACAKQESCATPEVCAKQESCATPEVCAKQESCALPEVCAKQEPCPAPEVCPKQETCAAIEPCAVIEACPKQETHPAQEACPKQEPCATPEACEKPEVDLMKESCVVSEVCPKQEKPAPTQQDQCKTSDVCTKQDSNVKSKLDKSTKAENCAKQESSKSEEPKTFIDAAKSETNTQEICTKPESCETPDSVIAPSQPCVPEKTDQAGTPTKPLDEKLPEKKNETLVVENKETEMEPKTEEIKQCVAGDKPNNKSDVNKNNSQKPSTASASKKKPAPVKGKPEPTEKKDASGDSAHPSMPVPPPRKKDPKKAAPAKPAKQPPKK